MRRRGARRGTALRSLLTAAALVGATAASATLVTGVASSAPAGADAIGQCTTSSGVVVVVDFSAWGGDVERGCALDPPSGMAALQSAGFGVIQVTTEPGFVCQITEPGSGVAEPESVPGGCNVTPPASSYWSYWHADAGSDTWTYSQLGAASATPGPGSVDAWVFGGATAANGGPSFSVDQVRATNATPVGTTTPTTAPPGAPPTTAATATTAPPSPTSTTAPLAAVTAPTTTVPASPGHPGPTGHTSPRIVDVPAGSSADVRATAHQTGSPVSLVVGAVAVAGLVGASVVALRRRRRAG